MNDKLYWTVDVPMYVTLNNNDRLVAAFSFPLTNSSNIILIAEATIASETNNNICKLLGVPRLVP